MMAAHFKGKVKNYFTLNEPQCTTSLGYQQGLHAPGLKLDLEGQFGVHVNQMLARGLAQRAIKEAYPTAIVGIASTGNLCYPQTETSENIDAATACRVMSQKTVLAATTEYIWTEQSMILSESIFWCVT